jgi:integrase
MTDTYRPDMPLNDLWQKYVSENPRIRSEHTRSLVKIAVQHFQAFLGRQAVLSDLTNENVVAYMEYRKQLHRSPRTIERETSKLTTLWRWAASNGWCEMPRFSIAKCAPPTPTAWSPREIVQIFDAASKYASTIGKLPGRLVMPVLLRMAYDTGERATALLVVKWSDVDLDGRWVTFRAETRKGGAGASDNLQRLSRKAARALSALQSFCQMAGMEAEFVFPQLHATSYYGHLRIMLKGAGLPTGRNCMLHKLRRTHATHLHVMGGDATASLGHTSDQMTRGYYLDPKYTRGGYLADMRGGLRGLWERLVRRVKVTLGLW